MRQSTSNTWMNGDGWKVMEEIGNGGGGAATHGGETRHAKSATSCGTNTKTK